MELIPDKLACYTLEYYLPKITTRSRIIYWIIIGIVVIGIVLLPFIYVDVSVQARGYFQAEIEKQIVYTPFQGKIVYTSIRNGGSVDKGDTLLIIESESIRALQVSLNQRISENNASIYDLEILTGLDSINLSISDPGLITKRYRAEFSNFSNQQTIQLQRYLKKRTEHERNKILYSQSIIPEADFENSLFILGSEKENLNQILVHQKYIWQNDLTARKNEAVKLFADLEQCREELTNRIILAPASGEILQSPDIQTGTVVASGQKMAEITPDGELIANCFVKPADIGLINEKQKVMIQVDAFNYREWGMLPADIIDISDDIIVDNESVAYFRIKCKPASTSLSLRDGKTAFIRKGMSLNARIVLIKRSLYHLLFDTADKWFNPYTYKRE